MNGDVASYTGASLSADGSDGNVANLQLDINANDPNDRIDPAPSTRNGRILFSGLSHEILVSPLDFLVQAYAEPIRHRANKMA